MQGYVPGEQPKDKAYIKLNTNENPYSPSPALQNVLDNYDCKKLKLYPDPVSSAVIPAATKYYGVANECILAGNGSDDILTIAIRSFVNENEKIAFLEPSYSLYPVLGCIQNSDQLSIKLDNDFCLPKDIINQLEDAKLFFLANPNAPIGNFFPKERIREICLNFSGIILIDEAYAEFADDNCLDLVDDYPNVIVSRTLSKSFSLAGIRMGFAIAQAELIAGMMKVKDSYNVNTLTQLLASAALDDYQYMQRNVKKIIASRQDISLKLTYLGARVLPSQTNFIFVKPNIISALEYFNKLRDRGILVRYFSSEGIDDYVRITIGTDKEMQCLYEATEEIFTSIPSSKFLTHIWQFIVI